MKNVVAGSIECFCHLRNVALWSRIWEENSVNKIVQEIVGNGKLTDSVLKETIAVSSTIRIGNQREPGVPEEEVPVVERLDGRARITSKELAQLQSVKSGIFQDACSTSPVTSALMRIAKLMNRLAKSLKKNGDKSAVAIQNCTIMGCVFQDIKPPKSSSILRKSSDIWRTYPWYVMLTFETKNPSLGMIRPGDPHQRNPNSPKFEDRSQEKTEWQERCAREAAWKLSKAIQNKRSMKEQHSSHLRKIGACLHQQSLHLRKEKLL